MRWWLLLGARAIALLVLHLMLIGGVNRWIPDGKMGKHLGYSFALMGADMVVFVLGYFLWQDQRYRCRTCARKLRMPVETGSWGKATIFAPPELEWICPYGHGAMRQKEVQLAGPERDKWQENTGDFWKDFENAWRNDGKP